MSTRSVRTTASALILRSLPLARPDTDTRKRLRPGQSATAYGESFDKAWQFVAASEGSGWASARYLQPAAAITPPTPTPLPATATVARPKVPNGLIELREIFGDPRPFIRSNGTVDPEWERRVTAGVVRLPAPLVIAWAPDQRATTVRCHPLIAPVLQAVYDEIHAAGLWAELRDYGGCYNFRNARGLSKLSTHCWALAVDHDVRRNPLGAKPAMDQRIVRIFERHGFVWGGRWSRPDGMHHQYVSGY